MGFRCSEFSSSGMWDLKSIYTRIVAGYPHTKVMIDELVETFNYGNFDQEKAILKIKYYNRIFLIVFKHLPVKGRENTTEINRLGNGLIIDTLTSVDIQEIVKK